MAATIYALLATFLFAQCLADTNPFEKMINEGKANMEKLMEDINAKMGLSKNPSGEEVVNAAKAQHEKMVAAMSDMSKKLEDQIKSHPESKEAMDKMKAKVDEVLGNLKKENPELGSNAQKMMDQAKEAMEKVNKAMQDNAAEFNKPGGSKDAMERTVAKFIDESKKSFADMHEKLAAMLPK